MADEASNTHDPAVGNKHWPDWLRRHHATTRIPDPGHRQKVVEDLRHHLQGPEIRLYLEEGRSFGAFNSLDPDEVELDWNTWTAKIRFSRLVAKYRHRRLDELSDRFGLPPFLHKLQTMPDTDLEMLFEVRLSAWVNAERRVELQQRAEARRGLETTRDPETLDRTAARHLGQRKAARIRHAHPVWSIAAQEYERIAGLPKATLVNLGLRSKQDLRAHMRKFLQSKGTPVPASTIWRWTEEKAPKSMSEK